MFYVHHQFIEQELTSITALVKDIKKTRNVDLKKNRRNNIDGYDFIINPGTFKQKIVFFENEAELRTYLVGFITRGLVEEELAQFNHQQQQQFPNPFPYWAQSLFYRPCGNPNFQALNVDSLFKRQEDVLSQEMSDQEITKQLEELLQQFKGVVNDVFSKNQYDSQAIQQTGLNLLETQKQFMSFREFCNHRFQSQENELAILRNAVESLSAKVNKPKAATRQKAQPK